MIAIKYYTDTKRELYIAIERKKMLQERLEKIDTRYLSHQLSMSEKQLHSHFRNDKMVAYMYEKEKVVNEIDDLEKEINVLQEYIHMIEETMKKLTSLPYRLYYSIVVDQRKISQAIEQLALETDKSLSTIWLIYKKYVKEEIKKLNYF